MLRFLSIVILIGLGASTDVAFGGSIRQQAGYFEDDEGVQRQRMRLDSTIEVGPKGGGSVLTTNNLNLILEQDIYRDTSARDDKFGVKYYEGGRKVRNSWNLGWNSTLAKLTDFRAMTSAQDDSIIHSRNFAVGTGHWFWHESIQVNLDVSRSLVDRPEQIVLDADTETIAPPPLLTSTGTSFSIKHLASPTTVTNYGASFITTNDRPLRQDYTFGVKRYIVSQKGALHFDVVRSINRGRIENTTTEGQLDAWIYELAYLQSIGKSTVTRLAWRQYREDEITRDSHRDELVRGTDLWTLAVLLDLKKLELTNAQVSLDGNYSRYRTNEIATAEGSRKLNAQTFELGATAKF